MKLAELRENFRKECIYYLHKGKERVLSGEYSEQDKKDLLKSFEEELKTIKDCETLGDMLVWNRGGGLPIGPILCMLVSSAVEEKDKKSISIELSAIL